jgi:hypothetical protein
MRTPLTGTTVRAVMVLVFALGILPLYSQYSCEGWDPTVVWNPTKQRIVTNQTVPGTGIIRNWLEYLPDEYNSTTKKYPLLIFFHGVNEGGGGSPCRLLQGEWWWTPPVIIERGRFPYSAKDQNGQDFKFIVISPRMEWFGDPSGTINAFIDHLVRTYRVDPGRIYLTGISAGTHYIMDFAGASEANARKVAAIMPVSSCGGQFNSQQAQNISRANLRVYSVGCVEDSCGGIKNQAARIANSINNVNPSANLAVHSTLQVDGPWPCNSGLYHDAWGTAFDTTFKPMLNGRNLNIYEWMLQFSRSATAPLPVALEKYTVTLSNGKVYVRWTTSAEQNSDHFTIERAGSNQQFSAIATVPAAGNSGSVKTYEWVDEHPLSNLNFYRLTQTDRDGQQQYFPTRKILNRLRWDRYVVATPNPFGGELSVFINVDKVQRVTFTLADISGRIVKTINGTYNEGATEVNFDGNKLPRGVYVLNVKGEFFSEVQRVVKQ